MRIKLLLLFFVVLVSLMTNAQVPARVGWWKFDDPNDLLKATIGKSLQLVGTQTSTDGPDTGNNATQIDLGSYYIMNHDISSGTNDTLINEWSMQIDFTIPEGGIWHTFFQTTPENNDDGDLFINVTNNVGRWAIGYSEKAVVPSEWYRMVVTAMNGVFFRIYMNGELWLEFTNSSTVDDIAYDGRMALHKKLLIFADNDGDDGSIICSELGIWDVALAPEDVAALGDVNTPSTGITNISNNGKSGLEQNFPNPFSSSTVFPYQIQKAGNVSFCIYDVTGKKIKVINEGMKSPGSYRLSLSSEKLQNGIYYVQMKTSNSVSTQKMIVNQ